MRYDSVSLYNLRYPNSDESLANFLHISAVSDPLKQVELLVFAMNREEISLSIVDNSRDILKYFTAFRPDVLAINIDTFGMGRFLSLTQDLQKLNDMPFLIPITDRRSPEIDELIYQYKGAYVVNTPFAPEIQAEKIEKFLLTRYTTPDFYRRKLMKCAELTLRTMGCDPTFAGFSLTCEAVCEVLENPYVRFDFERDIYPKLAEKSGLSATDVHFAIGDVVKDALSKMSDADKQIVFEEYVLYSHDPSYDEFIHAAANITSQPCRKILRNMQDRTIIY
jgi:hypothetical protein